jgi:hypothetical protein
MFRLSVPFLCAIAPVAGVAADATQEITGYAPVTISAANYRTTSRKDLVKAVERAAPVRNPETPGLKPLSSPQRYVMIRGEVFATDVTYEQITALLAAALAQKNYVNAVDAQERIYRPETVSLVLRVNYGTLFWRLPTVRTENLAYSDGMMPRSRDRRMVGGESIWDQRAGGNDEAFAALEANNTAAPFGGLGGSADRTEGGPALSNSDFSSTREFHVIVVDAFDYRELKKEGRYATRLWSTFVAAPKRTNAENFAGLAATLVRSATPYFGETSRGLQIYPDVGVKVNIGELIEVKSDDKK